VGADAGYDFVEIKRSIRIAVADARCKRKN